jgi:hypothetical protein
VVVAQLARRFEYGDEREALLSTGRHPDIDGRQRSEMIGWHFAL